MEYKLQNLQNELRLLTVPMPSLESATVTVWVKTGSRNESDEKLGISHFLEHMAFKGGKKYKSAKAVSEAIDEVGGEFNASTSKEITQFYIRIRSKLIERAFDVLSDMLLYPNLDGKEIKKEKGVILEEMSLYEDMPIRRVWDLFEQLIFKGHTLGRDIIGTKETVPALEKEDFVSYRDEHYRSGDMLITVSGGIEENSIYKLTDNYFGSIPTGKFEVKKEEVQNSNKSISLTNKKIEQAHIILGFPADSVGSKNRYSDAILDTILGSGMSSRLFTEVREKRGLAYSVRSDIDRFSDAGYFAVYAGVDPENTEEAIKIILNELYGFSEKKLEIDKKELNKAKEYLKGHLALGLEDTRGVNGFFGQEEMMLGKIRTPEEVFAKINEVGVEEIYESAKRIFKKEKIKLCIIGPFEDDKKFDNIL